MFKYNFNKDKHLKYQLKRCLESEPYDTLEDAKFKALINSFCNWLFHLFLADLDANNQTKIKETLDD